MTNKIKQLKCIQWRLNPSQLSDNTHRTENFSVLGHDCNLEFHLGKSTAFGCCNSVLYFKSCDELPFPKSVTVHVYSNSDILKSERESITSSNHCIWSYSAGTLVNLQQLTFEICFDDDFSKDDKSIQTPSYIDTRFMLESVSEDFSKLLDDDTGHDIEFTCGDQSFKAHKNVLCCRSAVLASMLQSDMVEGKTGLVNIQDIDATVFQPFLRGLYTGLLPDLTVDAAKQFYKTCDKYAVSTLKKQCAEFLIDNLSLENACEILVLADLHHDSDFKKSTMEYIFKEKIPVVSENWADFCKENQSLAVEVLNLFCQHICRK